ncbi:MAG: glycoside hydrolase family 2 [Lachnospiraceae bacterium]|nr:glycoside hydrolase family 2 [Lachnospiraceae bacterium]
MKKQIPLQSPFSEQLHPDSILAEYPRPTLARDFWINLNGFWEYAITKESHIPLSFDGQILVPFSPETRLSGVERAVLPDDLLWYRRTVSVCRPKDGGHLLLHFGAADQHAEVYINRILAGSHMGGYLPFSIDITDLVQTGDNEILVRVWDKTDTSYHSRGKQVLKPGGMYYTAQSGIWQTVWMEYVPENYIESIHFIPDFDARQIRFKAVSRLSTPFTCHISGEKMAPVQFSGQTNEELCVALDEFYPWSPEDPFLYQVKIQTHTDCVTSYFAMRKCDIQTDSRGIRRFFLNDKPYFQAGVLDQGYWPESLYTAPSDEALIFDILKMKELGFNMLRKHAKIEPERFYYHCDRLGMLVWQDMVNGGSSYKSWFVTYLATVMNWRHWPPFGDGKSHFGLLSRSDSNGRDEFCREVTETVTFLRNHPCIVVWVPFNEGWGQFESAKITEQIKKLDPSRLVDHASGWYDQKAGDIISLHYYFFSLHFKKEAVRALALTEFGGYSHQIRGHCSCSKEYGYKKFKNCDDLTNGYRQLIQNTILPAVKNGIGASIYTQVSDIEEETNGFYTYDRKVLKMHAPVVAKLNAQLKDAVCTQNPK